MILSMKVKDRTNKEEGEVKNYWIVLLRHLKSYINKYANQNRLKQYSTSRKSVFKHKNITLSLLLFLYSKFSALFV